MYYPKCTTSNTIIRSLISWLAASLLLPSMSGAAIGFEDVSKKSGAYNCFSTAASSWGDLNSDGWPDLWVSNHWHQRPSIYLNQQDGTFVDVTSDVLEGDLPADFHGASWADFDNDGDQDLLVVTGGGAGSGSCPNYLFINNDGRLMDQAAALGVTYPLGRGRVPLWFDADGDGKLDFLVANRIRPGGKAPSSIFLNTPKGFIASNAKFGFNPSGFRSRSEKIADLIDNAIHMRFRKGPGQINVTETFAQLSDLNGDRNIDLISYVNPMRTYSTESNHLKENTNDLGFPAIGSVQDVAIEDMNGDGMMDMFLARSYPGQGISQPDATTLKGRIVVRKDMEYRAVSFQSKGKLKIKIFTIWIDPSTPQEKISSIRVGNNKQIPVDGRPIILDPLDSEIQQTEDSGFEKDVSIGYIPHKELWQLSSSLPEINFIISSKESINHVETIGFESSKVELDDYLLVQKPDGSKLKFSPAIIDRTHASAGKSVVAGDFDNDMDVDIYIVCASPSQNLPNRLYENDGQGHFKEISDAGGAKGSKLGKGNQVVTADYDRDGFLDLFVTNGAGQPPIAYEGPHQLFRNKGNDNHWLEIDLQGTHSNRDGIGSIVELEAGGVKQVRIQGGGIHSFSQNHQRIHFGLGRNTKADRVVIRWPSGTIQELNNISADQILTIVETIHTEH